MKSQVGNLMFLNIKLFQIPNFVLGCLKEYTQRKNGRVDKGQKLFITYYHIVVVQQGKQSI